MGPSQSLHKKCNFPLKVSSHLLKKYQIENFIFCAVNYLLYGAFDQG